MSESRFTLNFTLSVLEKTEAGKLIKEHENNEFIKPYGAVHAIKKSAYIVFLCAAMTNFIILIGLIFLTSNDPGFPERAKYFSIVTLSLVTTSVVLLYIYDFLMRKIMRKNHSSEIDDDELNIKLKINRSYIEQIMNIDSSKAFWNNVKKVYRKEGYLFIQREDNRCVVIPERIFKNELEINTLYSFIKDQVSVHNQKK